MANLIELKKGERPRPGERHALVIACCRPPACGAPIIDRGPNRTFYADDTPHDIALIVGRATVWAADNRAHTIYLRRDS